MVVPSCLWELRKKVPLPRKENFIVLQAVSASTCKNLNTLIGSMTHHSDVNWQVIRVDSISLMIVIHYNHDNTSVSKD